MDDLTPFFGHPSDRKIWVRHPVGYLFASVAWRDSSQGPMRSDVVVVVPPVSHSLLHLCKGEEEIHVEALISKLAIKALNVEAISKAP